MDVSFVFIAVPTHPSLFHYALAVLNTNDTETKASLTLEAKHFITEKKIPIRLENEQYAQPPDHPARPLNLENRRPGDMPKPIKNDPDNNRLRLIHSLCHIESYAIDLSWDILVRFSYSPSYGVTLPDEYYIDWLRIAAEEAIHFSIWNDRLIELGHKYGDLPVHDGLW